jgi:hypothetical protein
MFDSDVTGGWDGDSREALVKQLAAGEDRIL